MVDLVKFQEEEKPKKRQKISFKKIFYIFLLVFIISSIMSSITYTVSPKIAVVEIKGVILSDNQDNLFSNSVSSREIANQLYKYSEDETYKAVLLDINSPGGSPVASEEISKAIDHLKEKNISVYTLYNDIGASGAFWIGESADKVYASPMSTVGSIGVTSAGLSFEDFIKEYNITYRRLVAGKYKDIGTPFREMTKEEEEMIQEILDEIYSNFINHIAKERNMSYEEVEKYADGRLFLGTKAKEYGFVDELGYYNDVIKDIKNVTGENVLIEKYVNIPSFLDQLSGVYSNINPINEKYSGIKFR
jgi:protease-4